MKRLENDWNKLCCTGFIGSGAKNPYAWLRVRSRGGAINKGANFSTSSPLSKSIGKGFLLSGDKAVREDFGI
jgi:hypothetical protein